MFNLHGKTACITGAGRGLGAGIARALANQGAKVTLVSRSEHEIKPLAQELNGEYLVLDVTKETQKLGTYDIFINNAGMNKPEPFLAVSEQNFDDIFNLNVRAAFFAAQNVAKNMVIAKKNGVILNISSQMGHVGAQNRSVYCASKHALEGLTKTMAIELASHNIRVNTICPTFVETHMTKPFFENEDFKKQVLGKIKLGRMAKIEEIAAAAVYLSSDEAKMITGTHLLIDGGWVAE